MKPRPANETGILLREGGQLILSMTGGGHWQLELTTRIDVGLIGRRVNVQGERVEFNTLAVKRMSAA